MTTQYRIVLVRHGESEWNLENRFCGNFTTFNKNS